MTGQTFIVILIAIGLMLADGYIIKSLKSALKWRFLHKKWFATAYWFFAFVLIAGLFLSVFLR